MGSLCCKRRVREDIVEDIDMGPVNPKCPKQTGSPVDVTPGLPTPIGLISKRKARLLNAFSENIEVEE